MTSLLISGSRADNVRLRDYARRCVDRAKAQGWSIIVGDAHGIDEAVMTYCDIIGVPCTVYGANNEIRRQTASCQIVLCKGNFLARDYDMAKAADRCIAIWNGKVKPNGRKSGTEQTFEYAVKLGKPAWLVACIDGEMRIIQRSNVV